VIFKTEENPNLRSTRKLGLILQMSSNKLGIKRSWLRWSENQDKSLSMQAL